MGHFLAGNVYWVTNISQAAVGGLEDSVGAYE
jgi:hypothetical protein